MKKNKYLTPILVVCFLFLFLGFSFLLEADKEIKVDKWIEAVESGGEVVTVLGRTDCPHCQNYKPIITKFSEEVGINLFFFEVDKLSKEDYDIVFNKYDLKNFVGAVPYTFVVRNNEFVDSVTGGMEEADLNEFLKESGFEFYSVANWIKAVESGESVVTVLGSSTCPHCQSYKPVITKFAKKENITLFFFEVDKLSDDDYNTVYNKYVLENNEGYVPYTFVVKNNKFVNDVTGGMEEKNLKEFLKESGFKF